MPRQQQQQVRPRTGSAPQGIDDVAALQIDVVSLLDENSRQEKNLHSTLKSIQELNDHVNGCRNAFGEVTEKRSQIQSEIQSAESECKKLECELDNVKDDCHRLSTLIDELGAEADRVESEVSVKTKNVTLMNNKFHQYKLDVDSVSEIHAAIERVDAETEEKQRALSELRDEKKRLADLLERGRAEVERFTSEQDEMMAILRERQDRIFALRRQELYSNGKRGAMKFFEEAETLVNRSLSMAASVKKRGGRSRLGSLPQITPQAERNVIVEAVLEQVHEWDEQLGPAAAPSGGMIM